MTGLPQTQEMERRADSIWSLHGFLLLCIAALFAYAYLDTFRELWDYWIEGYNWQFVVPIGFAYMLWDRSDLYAGLHREPGVLPGVILLLAGCALLIVGQLSSTHSLRELSIIVNVFGLVFLLFGGKYVRKLFWPLIYLVLMTSLTSDLLEYLRYPLKLISATVSADALQLFGYVVYREDTFLQLPHITLEVADSCSGLNQLVSSIALGIPIAFTILNAWWKRVFIILLCVALGIVMNWVRVFLISIWHYDSAKEVIHGPYGIYELPFIFLIGVFITLAVALAMADKEDMRARQGHKAISGTAPVRPADGRSVRASIVAMLVLSLTALYLNTWKAEAVELQGGFADFPMTIAGFRGKPADALGKPFYTGLAHNELIASYVNQAGETARVYVGYFHSQNQQEEVIDYRYNWLHGGAETVELPVSSAAYAMKTRHVRAGGRDVSVFFSYDINGRNIIEPRQAKLASLFDAVIHRRTNGAIIMVVFDNKTANLTSSEQEFLRQVVSTASAHLPGD
jgi:EpsI family protein